MNRGFLYGDGFFETIKVVDGVPVFWEQHWQRILRTSRYLKARLSYSEQEFRDIIKVYINENQPRLGRLRITFYREGEGKYLPKEHTLNYFFDFEASSQRAFELSQLNAQVRSSVVLPTHDSGNYKLISKTLQIKAAIEAQEEGCNEAIMLNDRGELAEGIAGNIFILKIDQLYTPSLDSGCLAGTTRAIFLSYFSETKECELYLEDIDQADAVFLTNSIKGIQIVNANDKGRLKLEEVMDKLNLLMLNSIQDF